MIVGTFAAYAKIITVTEERRVLEGVFIKRRCVNTGKDSGCDSLDHPPVITCREGRRKINKKGLSGRIKC